jgi:hypothetical protein
MAVLVSSKKKTATQSQASYVSGIAVSSQQQFGSWLAIMQSNQEWWASDSLCDITEDGRASTPLPSQWSYQADGIAVPAKGNEQMGMR